MLGDVAKGLQARLLNRTWMTSMALACWPCNSSGSMYSVNSAKSTTSEKGMTAVRCGSKNTGIVSAARQSIVACRLGPSPGGWMQYLQCHKGEWDHGH